MQGWEPRLSAVGDRAPPPPPRRLPARPPVTVTAGTAGWESRRPPRPGRPGEVSREAPVLEKEGGEAGRPTNRSQPASSRRELGDGERTAPGGGGGFSRGEGGELVSVSG